MTGRVEAAQASGAESVVSYDVTGETSMTPNKMIFMVILASGLVAMFASVARAPTASVKQASDVSLSQVSD